MKKIFLIGVCLLILAGCTNTEKKENDNTDFELVGNPSTGFEWICLDDNDIVDINYTTKSHSNDKTATGSPVTYYFKLTGKEPGQTTIKCTYRRIWESVLPADTKEFLVKVDSELKVDVQEITE